jgi:NAD(P)-dependent dehydrogenase (short-subunit alcohol dehydrogenase family)
VIGLVRDRSVVEARLAKDNILNVNIFQADLTNYKALDLAAEQISNVTGGSLDFLIVNGAYVSTSTAGLAPSEFIGKEDLLQSELETSFLTNVLGPWCTINSFISLVGAGNSKKIVVISSGMSDPEFAQIAGIPGALT